MRSNFCYVLVCLFALLSACSQSPKKEAYKPALTPAVAPAPVVTTVPATPVKDKKADSLENKMICKNDVDSRSLEIVSSSPQGCKLMYSKHGKDAEIASSRKGIDHCKNVLAKVEVNLKNGGFECMKVEGAVATKN